MDDLGGAFSMGCVGGGLFYFFKGFYNAPSRERMRGAMTAVKIRAPILGGSFAMWGGIFASCDCGILFARQDDSPMNAVAAGALTGGILAIRSGYQIAWRNALAGGIILGIIEGVNVAYTSSSIRQQMQMMDLVNKIQMEREIRRMKGLPDFTQDEIKARLEPP